MQEDDLTKISLEYKSVSSKLRINELTQFRDYCERKGTTPSALIRELIKKEIEIAVPHSIAGNNIIEYNKDKDNFTWSVKTDNGEEFEVLNDVSPEFLEDLDKMITKVTEERVIFLGKVNKNSIPVPTNILRRD